MHRKFFVGFGALTYAATTLIAATTASTTLAVTMIVIANAGLAFYVVPYWLICTDVAPNQTGTLGGVMNFFGIVGATVSPYLSGVIAQASGAFVAPLVLAVDHAGRGDDHDRAVPYQAIEQPFGGPARRRETGDVRLKAPRSFPGAFSFPYRREGALLEKLCRRRS